MRSDPGTVNCLVGAELIAREVWLRWIALLEPLDQIRWRVPGMLEWMPSSPGAAWMLIVCVTAAPQSPPWATNRNSQAAS